MPENSGISGSVQTLFGIDLTLIDVLIVELKLRRSSNLSELRKSRRREVGSRCRRLSCQHFVLNPPLVSFVGGGWAANLKRGWGEFFGIDVGSDTFTLL